MAMCRWVPESTTALASPAAASAILAVPRPGALTSSYLACTALAVAWTPYDVSETWP